MTNNFAENTILRLCQQPRTFEYITNNLKGLDPIKAKDILDQLIQKNVLSEINGMWVIKQVEQAFSLSLFPTESQLYLKKYMGYFDFLKTPHPLDFEWRNSTASLLHLISKLQQLCTVKDSILILGMPTLFATAHLKDIPQKVTLIEKNKPILQGIKHIVGSTERFRIIDANIFNINPNLIEKHFCVIMDPPWYTEHFFQFIWVAAQCVTIGGLVGISIPPINTRPDIPQERIEWLSFCHQAGLCIETLDSQLLEYAMPFFEFNAFRAAGITDVLPFWRKGDFMIFRKVKEVNVARPLLNAVSDEWQEREVNSVRFRVRLKQTDEQNENETITINSIIKGDILPTVSRRNELREKANIWTSGNRIFSTNNPWDFFKSLDYLSQRNLQSGINNSVHDFISLISNLEEKEFNNYLEWLYYEMERQAN